MRVFNDIFLGVLSFFAESQKIVELLASNIFNAFVYSSFFLLGLIFSWLKTTISYLSFKRSFGDNVRLPSDIVVCLPAVSVRSFGQPYIRAYKTNRSQIVQEFDWSPSEATASLDVEAGIETLFFISEYFSDPIKFEYDISNFNLEGKTIITIGLHLGNSFTKSVLDYIDSQNMYSQLRYFFRPHEHVDDVPYHDSMTGEQYFSDDKFEYASVSRVPNYFSKSGGYIYVVGGIYGAGSIAAARFLRLHWKDFATADSVASILLRLPRDKPNHTSIVGAHGFRKSENRRIFRRRRRRPSA